MAGLINELMNNMADMAAQLEGLIALAREKKDIIIKNDVETLKAITAKENTLAGKFQKAEKTGGVLIKDIALVLNQPEQSLTLRKLSELIEGQEDYPAYMEYYNGLTSRISELKELNDANRVLIESALGYIDYTVNAIRSTFGGGEEAILDTKN